jgi:hypothetical protein
MKRCGPALRKCGYVRGGSCCVRPAVPAFDCVEEKHAGSGPNLTGTTQIISYRKCIQVLLQLPGKILPVYPEHSLSTDG